jgi:hypothetical protein
MKTTKIRSLTFFLIALVGVAHFDAVLAKSVGEKTKHFIDEASESLKKGVDKLGDDMNSIQSYLDNYHWKGLIQDEATSGVATLKHLELKNHAKAIVVKPGERVEGIVQCNLDREQCSNLKVYRVVLGLQGKGAQTTIGNELGVVAGESLESFALVAPSEAGIYQIRFRTVEGLFEKTALDGWLDGEGNEPDGTTTIGLIVVR